MFFVAASTRHISHSGHADLRCIKCNIVAVIKRRRSRPGKMPGHQQQAPPRTSSPPGNTYPRPPNPVLHLMQLSPELKPRHQPPAAPSRPPPRREARNELKPPAAFRVTVGRTAAPAISAPAFPAALVPGIAEAAGRTHRMHARLSGARQASTRTRRGPSVPSVENPAVTPTVLAARNRSAMRPWTAQHNGLQRDKVTHAGTEKKRPASTRIRS